MNAAYGAVFLWEKINADQMLLKLLSTVRLLVLPKPGINVGSWETAHLPLP